MILPKRTTLCLLLGAVAATLPASGGETNSPAASGINSSPASQKNYHFGVNTHFGQGWDPVSILPSLNDSGIGWIRDEIYPFHMPETSPGVYSIDPGVRKWVELVSSQGIRINVILNDGRGSNGKKPLYEDPDAYARMAAFIAKEFQGKVQAIEVLNEPQHFGFMELYKGSWNGMEADGSSQMWIKKYAELLNKTAEAVKAVNPEIKVIGMGAMAPANCRMMREGISSKVDGVTDHPYSHHMVPEIVPLASNEAVIKRDGFATADSQGSLASFVEMYREEMKQSNGPRELWFTEWGYPTYLEGKGEPPSRLFRSGFSQIFSPVSERSQTCYILRRYVESLALGVEASFLYDFKNDGTDPYNAEYNFGLVDASLKPKPSYHAVKNLVRMTSGLTPAKAVGISVFPFADDRQDPRPITWDGIATMRAPGDIKAYQFTDPEGHPVIAVWSAERAGNDMPPRSADFEFRTGEPGDSVQISDPATGETRTVSATPTREGLLLKNASVPDYPVFIKLPGLARPRLPATMPATAPGLIDPQSKNWTFHSGQEFPPGGRGAVEIRGLKEGAQLDLAYNFSAGGNYVGAENSTLNCAAAADIRFSARATSSCRLVLRLEDNKGETFQFTLTYDSPGQWKNFRKEISDQMMTKDIFGGGADNIFGGDANKRFDFPVKKILLGIENPVGVLQEPTGVVEFRDLQFGEPHDAALKPLSEH